MTSLFLLESLYSGSVTFFIALLFDKSVEPESIINRHSSALESSDISPFLKYFFICNLTSLSISIGSEETDFTDGAGVTDLVLYPELIKSCPPPTSAQKTKAGM